MVDADLKATLGNFLRENIGSYQERNKMLAQYLNEEMQKFHETQEQELQTFKQIEYTKASANDAINIIQFMHNDIKNLLCKLTEQQNAFKAMAAKYDDFCIEQINGITRICDNMEEFCNKFNIKQEEILDTFRMNQLVKDTSEHIDDYAKNHEEYEENTDKAVKYLEAKCLPISEEITALEFWAEQQELEFNELNTLYAAVTKHSAWKMKFMQDIAAFEKEVEFLEAEMETEETMET